MKNEYCFFKFEPNDKIWMVSSNKDPLYADAGRYLFSFDKKTIYNFWTDWDKLTEEQKQIFRTENPVMARLKE